MIPRKPTKEEKEQLAGYHLYDDFLFPDNETEQEAYEDVEEAAIAVFENYATSEFRGKVAVVVWSKSYVKAYHWDDTNLLHPFD